MPESRKTKRRRLSLMRDGRRRRISANWSCPLPLVGYPTIVMGHGGGGKLGNELVEHLFLPAFRNAALENLGDAAVLDLASAAGWL